MNEATALEDRLAGLRSAFDRSFAIPPAGPAAESEDFIAVRVAADPYVIRLRDLSGMLAGRKITPLPSSSPGLIGLAGIRGSIIPVYGLAPMLGYAPAGDPARWLALYRNDDPIAFAFENFEGFARLPKAIVCSEEHAGSRGMFVREIARLEPEPRPIIDIPLLASSILKAAGSPGTQRSPAL